VFVHQLNLMKTTSSFIINHLNTWIIEFVDDYHNVLFGMIIIHHEPFENGFRNIILGDHLVHYSSHYAFSFSVFGLHDVTN
jgi:hypothetical protein